MMLSNQVSRFHVAAAAVRGAAAVNEKVAVNAHNLTSSFLHLAAKAKEYARENGQGAFEVLLLCFVL